MLCFTPESLEFLLWIFIYIYMLQAIFLLQAGSHLTNTETSGESVPHRSSFRTSGFLQQGWSRFLHLHQWPLKYPCKASASWYFSIASLVGVKLVKKNNEENEKKNPSNWIISPWIGGEKLEHRPIRFRKRSWPNDSAIMKPYGSWPNIGPSDGIIGTISQIFCFFFKFLESESEWNDDFGIWCFFFVLWGRVDVTCTTPPAPASVKLAGLSVTLTGTSSPESVPKKKDVIYEVICIYIYYIYI